MDYRNFSPNKFYKDESLQPQGPRTFRTSTPRGRRANPYQNKSGRGFGSWVDGSPPGDGRWTCKRSNDSWRSRDSSGNSSFNSPYNSPGQRFQDFNSSIGCRNIEAYYDPSMMENPWLELEEAKAAKSAQSVSFSAESRCPSEGYKISDSSDGHPESPDVIIQSITEHSCEDMASSSGESSS